MIPFLKQFFLGKTDRKFLTGFIRVTVFFTKMKPRWIQRECFLPKKKKNSLVNKKRQFSSRCFCESVLLSQLWRNIWEKNEIAWHTNRMQTPWWLSWILSVRKHTSCPLQEGELGVIYSMSMTVSCIQRILLKMKGTLRMGLSTGVLTKGARSKRRDF